LLKLYNKTKITQSTMDSAGVPVSAVPMLKVMRIQSPELTKTSTPSPTSPRLSSALILPDSFGVIHIGETFTAYLGAINVNQSSKVLNLSVSATLQTPTRRFAMPSALENKFPATPKDRQNYQPLNIEPHRGIDTIISKPLEEPGQHILRVEVSYGGQEHRLQGPILLEDGTNPNPRKMLRKFYRFNVSSPLHIRELTLRGGESTCIVSLAVENTASPDNNNNPRGGLTISQNEFQPYRGLIAQRIQPSSTTPHSQKTAVELFDESGRLNPGESRRYMFEVKAASEDANIRGIARGDELGKAIVTWHKAMGEAGRIASTFVYCPPSAVEEDLNSNNKENNPSANGSTASHQEEDRFVVQGSGLSVDVAASAADRSASHSPSEIPNTIPLDDRFPVTVEPINPPKRMMVGEPVDIQVLIVNHGTKNLDLQLQMRLPLMKGIVVYGQSFRNLGEIPPNGGSVVSKIRLIAMVPGLFFVGGCFVVDLNSGMEIKQPNLFSVFVENNSNTKD
jgi:hypothetical protein